MSECIGAGCKHMLHNKNTSDNSETVHKVHKKKKPLTRNQKKARRRRGLHGY